MSAAARRTAFSGNVSGDTTVTPGVLTTEELLGIYAVSAPRNNPQVNGVKAPRLSSYGDIYAAGNIICQGRVIAGGGGRSGLPDGTELQPSLYFINEPELGLWRPSSGVIGLTDGLNPIANASATTFSVNNELSTIGGNDLSILPGGPNVNFNGKNLINVGAIIVNPNYFQAITDTPITTSDATPTGIIDIATTSDAAYTVRTEISGISVTDSNSVCSITMFASFKNIGGTVSALTPKLQSVITDAPLAGVSASLIVSGITVQVAVIGLAGTNIRWSGGSNVTRAPLA